MEGTFLHPGSLVAYVKICADSTWLEPLGACKTNLDYQKCLYTPAKYEVGEWGGSDASESCHRSNVMFRVPFHLPQRLRLDLGYGHHTHEAWSHFLQS